MKIVKKLLLGLLLIVAIIALIGFLFINSLTPTYEGEKELQQLADQVDVYFDSYGIPHIYASSEEDALRTLGYVHAQDRLWQMELLRRAGSGRLSEVFGELTVETDKFFRSLGIDEHNSKNLENMDANDPVIKLTEAYLDGINQFIAEGPTPVEFYLTGLEKSEFTLKDVMNAVSYMGFTFNKGARDIVNTNLINVLDSVYTKELFDDNPSDAIKIPVTLNDSVTTSAMVYHNQIQKALENLPIPEIYGSNSWVLSPAKTVTGDVLFENDPHIAQAQPSVWYEAHLVTPNYEKYGYYLAGVPFPLLSHDRNMAHGFTMLANDDTNFYYEENHPSDTTLYKYKDEWRSYKYVEHVIKVKDAEDIIFTVKRTHRGPIVNENYANRTRVKGEKPVSMYWLFTQFDNQLLHGLYGINHAANIEEFQESLPKIHAPGLNVMYGDKEGNVAWWGTAKLYRLAEGLSTKFILNGASGQDDPIEFLPFSENPHAINPESNYVYSANNQPDSTAGMFVPGYFANSENRAGRIMDAMKAKPSGWSKEDMANLANDVKLRTAESFVDSYFAKLKSSEFSDEQLNFIEAFKAWNGTFSVEDNYGLFYEYLRKNLHSALFADEFESMEVYSSYGVQLKLDKIFKNDSSVWWDNRTTVNRKETKIDILNQTFKTTWQEVSKKFGNNPMEWKWNKVHFLEHDHPIGRVASLREYFNVGPFPSPGTGGTLNNQGFRNMPDGSFKVTSIPSTRRIIDFSDIENSISILPTGQSGNPFSQFYKDQAEMYINGEFRKMMMNENEIKKTSELKLTFLQKN